MQYELGRSPQWLAAIDQLYEAVGREQQLARALGAFRDFFNARSASFFTVADARHPATSHIGAVGMSDQMLVEYHSHYNVHDEWVSAAVRRSDFGPGAVYRGGELVRRSDLQRSYFARHFLSRHMVSDVLAAVVETSTGDGPTSFVSFHRHRGSRPFTATHVHLLRALAPHMRQAFRLHRRLAPKLAIGATLYEIMQRIDTPLVFLGADGSIVDRNSAATMAFSHARPWLRERTGRLLLAMASGWQDVNLTMQSLGTAVLVLDLVSEERQCATLELMPVQGAASDPFAEHPTAAIASLRYGARDKGLALRKVHGLTPAEVRIAMLLAEGYGAADVASKMDLSITTIRTHIYTAMGKLGLKRQAQMVALVLSL